MAGRTPDDPPPDLSGDWQLDAEPGAAEQGADAPRSPEPETPPPTHHPPLTTQQSADPPPSPEQLVEAMLFVGGPPLAADTILAAVRGLTAERLGAAIDELNRLYRRQRRPYAVQSRDGGLVLAVLPAYRGLRERLLGGPREARLGQPALDVLSVVAYRQPVGKAEVDAARGTDSGAVLRQLVRLGLIAVQHRAEAGTREVRYGTTPRFLRVFGLGSLDDLPRLGETAQV
jgi:segregation and condensation protein B